MSCNLLWNVKLHLDPTHSSHPVFNAQTIPALICIHMMQCTHLYPFGCSCLFISLFAKGKLRSHSGCFRPNGGGQINLSVLMSANGTDHCCHRHVQPTCCEWAWISESGWSFYTSVSSDDGCSSFYLEGELHLKRLSNSFFLPWVSRENFTAGNDVAGVVEFNF